MRTILFCLCLCACVSEQGQQGVQGIQGEPGAVGPAGPASTSEVYRPELWLSCHAALDLIPIEQTDGLKETQVQYQAVGYINHDVQVSCSVAVGSLLESSDSRFYPNILKGAEAGACITGTSLPGAVQGDRNAGYWEFETLSRAVTATYHDDLHPLDGIFYSFGSDDCKAARLNSDLEWTSVDLLAVVM